MIVRSIRSGISTILRHKRMIVLYYMFNLMFGIILAIPFYTTVNSFAGYSLMGEKLGGKLDMDFLFEFLKNSPDFFGTMRFLLLILALVYWLWGLFLSGGAFACFLRNDGYSASTFWGNAAKYYGRFFRLFPLSIPIFIIFFCLQFIETGVVRLIYGKDPNGNVIFWGAWIKTGIAYIGILLYSLVLDYARIYVVAADEWRMRKALWYGIKFTLRRFIKVFSIIIIFFFIGIVALIVYNPLADLLHTPGTVLLIALFIIQQVYIFIRMALKLTLHASEVKFFSQFVQHEDSFEPAREQAYP